MNIRIDAPDALQELFFRTADRMRVEGCVNAVTHEGLSLALSCAHEVLLDHYLQILLQRLRSSSPDITVDVYFPTNTESLIARFNEALADQSVRQATRAGADASAPKIWLVHDAQQLPEQELQLLARLIQNFPGANIRAILLMIGEAPSQEYLSAFGRKLLRWDIEGPTEEQAEAALEIARHHGQGDVMSLMLRRMGRQRRSPSAWAAEIDTVNTPPVARAPVAPAPAPQVPQTPDTPEAESGKRWGLPRWRIPTGWKLPQRLPLQDMPQASAVLDKLRQRGPLLGLAAGALALSVLLMMWLQPASFGLRGSGRAAPAETAVKVPEKPPVSVTSVSTPAPPAPAVDLPDPAVEGQTWAKALPGSSFLIQHGSMATFDKAQQLVSSFASLREAHIVAAWRPGEKLAHFVVVSGPYEAAGKAYERINKRDLPNTSWVRATQSLQQQLAAPSANAQESR